MSRSRTIGHRSPGMSSTPQTEPEIEALRQAVMRRLKANVTGLERIGGGRNSQVYKVATAGAEQFALKVYFRSDTDERNRLATEFESFTYL